MTDAWMLRTAIIVAGVLLLAAIYFFGRPRKPGQGRRVEGAARGGFADGGRVEPTLGELIADELRPGEDADGDGPQSEMDLGAPAAAAAAGSSAGRRVSRPPLPDRSRASRCRGGRSLAATRSCRLRHRRVRRPG